ncbi:hypothetical protein C5167_044136, partial [Papaver somniferum]
CKFAPRTLLRKTHIHRSLLFQKRYVVGAGAQEKAVPSKREERELLQRDFFFVTWCAVNVAKSFEYLDNWQEKSLIQVLL